MRSTYLPQTLLTFAILLPAYLAVAKDKPAPTQSPDAVISIDLADKHQILILKDRQIADSLFRLKSPPVRTEFERFVQDTAISVEVKTRAEFRQHWTELERREGFHEMRAQYAAADHEGTRIPRVYLFDSSVVVYPGWVVMRRKGKR